MLLNKRISILYFIRQIRYQILYIILFATAIGFVDMHPWLKGVTIPVGIPALLGTAVSLLLAFRTSQSYERWWEARIIWGAIVNDSRTLVRLSLQFLSKEEADQIAMRQVIWVYSLSESLRRQPFSIYVVDYLERNRIKATNIPNALLDEHSKQIKVANSNGQVSDFGQIQLNEIVTRLCDSMGRCERIKNTVFPRSYSVLLHTLIYVFAAMLPFGLDDEQLLVEVILTILIPVIFLSIEKTAIIMQDPFENSPADTPMTKLCQTIEINLTEMCGLERVTDIGDTTGYYQM
ncbi:bestrophin family ion channel [Flavobacterium coralii]|uniref:bestrophin family protein n=1 Tax=Flavobacterium coralii TaxID=2838017 RepID=UPI000C4833B7|nr:hypothetical protein [Flavobacterium sp.]|tara:strand:- start:1060 stop:1932 length:873 start_codon:yes stop_codon:yes gene_type:complete